MSMKSRTETPSPTYSPWSTPSTIEFSSISVNNSRSWRKGKKNQRKLGVAILSMA
ncbi:hypothetical protein C1H46_008932 [Malus baccata]|uniref:Uncharacterized protein n=1 Tax=Malus baccata TaxID=106549 RepID=A0A540N374_MALBA|nr:hypothetical protein C1H46_008932 [Malus baccata]